MFRIEFVDLSVVTGIQTKELACKLVEDKLQKQGFLAPYRETWEDDGTKEEILGWWPSAEALHSGSYGLALVRAEMASDDPEQTQHPMIMQRFHAWVEDSENAVDEDEAPETPGSDEP